MRYDSFLSGIQKIAVVGATQIKNKYGWRVFWTLKQLGLPAVPINPKYTEVEGERCYASVTQWVEETEMRNSDHGLEKVLVVTIVPPDVTKQIVSECRRVGIGKVWMQPGSFDNKTIKAIKTIKTISFVSEGCIVVDGYNQPLLVG